MLGFIFVFTIFVCLLVNDFIRKCGAKWRQLCKFPGDRPLPLIGNALTIGFDSDEAAKRIYEVWERHGKKSFRMSMGSENWVFLTNPDEVGTFYADNNILSKSPERNNAVTPFFGESVSTAEGERWRFTRKLVLTSFHVKALQQKLSVVNSRADHLIYILSQHDDKAPVSLYRYLRPFTLDIVFNSLMGVDNNFLKNIDHPYMIESGKVINMMTENYFSHWRNIKPIFALTSTYREMQVMIKVIKDTANDVIIRRRSKLNKIIEEIKINNQSSTVDIQELISDKLSEENLLLDAFLTKKLPNGEPIPDNIINEEISFVYFTGHYTIAITISHTLYTLAKNPEIQERVIEEQKLIFKDDYLRHPTMQDLNEMKYLEAAIKETIRVIPTVPKIGRKLKHDLLLKDGRTIPSGTTVIVYYEAIFSNDKNFSEPQKFNPDRFLEKDIHPHAFLPFGGGPRSCIGFRLSWMTMKATLSNILRQFEVVPAGDEPQFCYRILTESKNDILVTFKKRNV